MWRPLRSEREVSRRLRYRPRSPGKGGKGTRDTFTNPEGRRRRAVSALRQASRRSRSLSTDGWSLRLDVDAHGVEQAELLVGGDLQVLVGGEAPEVEAAHLGAAQVGARQLRLVDDG